MKRAHLVLLALLATCKVASAFILDEDIFSLHSTDPLAPRDYHGLLHQMPAVREVDFAPRYHYRYAYYFKASEQVSAQPAYVAALQRDLKRLGYYCGPIDGLFSFELSDAIARFQKNSSMRVTGTLTDPVRRALRLP